MTTIDSDNYREKNEEKNKDLIQKIKQRILRAINPKEAIEKSIAIFPHVLGFQLCHNKSC